MAGGGRDPPVRVVVRHHELGYRANAMTVWDVPDDVATEFGRALAASEGVTLAYRRARHLPEWPYNLYCMVHGVDRRSSRSSSDRSPEAWARRVSARGALQPHRFKQAGARVASLEAADG